MHLQLTAGSQACSFFAAEVKLTNLLGRTTSTTSVNEFIKHHKINIPFIENDLTLTAWAALSAQEKQARVSDVVSFDGHPKLQQAQMLAQISERNNSALTVLASLGIETLEQFSRKSTAELHTVDSGVVKQLNEALVRQLWEILDTYVDAFKARVGERRPYSAHLRMKELTYRHQYADIQRMLGRFHKATVDTILKMSFPLSMWGPKEGNPIVYLVAAPRQGKSLMLTEVADRAAKRGFVGVLITFNNFTALKPENADSARGAL